MTKNGTFTAYSVETKKYNQEKWDRFTKTEKSGVPYPLAHSGILFESSLLGHDQAMAVAWGILAIADAELSSIGVQVRVVPHEVQYSIEAKPMEDEAHVLGT